eukprot:3598510-Amphidinium_carterae.1
MDVAMHWPCPGCVARAPRWSPLHDYLPGSCRWTEAPMRGAPKQRSRAKPMAAQPRAHRDSSVRLGAGPGAADEAAAQREVEAAERDLAEDRQAVPDE